MALCMLLQLVSNASNAKTSVSDQREHRCCRRTGRFFEIGSGARPTPVSATTKKTIGEIVEQPAIGRGRIRRKTIVANHFGYDSLRDIVSMVIEYLKIKVAMRIDEF